MLPPDLQRLKHIRDYCLDIEQTMERFGKTWEAFSADRDYQKSVSFGILQIGELSGNLSPEFRKATADRIQWGPIKGMRNWVAHNYGHVSMDVVWKTAVEDIPELQRFCEEMLEKTEQADNTGCIERQ